jgi:hypothetical protein
MPAYVAFNAIATRPFIHVIFVLAVTADGITSPHILFAPRAAV